MFRHLHEGHVSHGLDVPTMIFIIAIVLIFGGVAAYLSARRNW